MLRRGLRAQSCLAVVALLMWTLVPSAAIGAPPSTVRSLDAPDYYEVAAAVGKDGLDAALPTAPCVLIAPQPVPSAPAERTSTAWHGFELDLADIRSPPSA